MTTPVSRWEQGRAEVEALLAAGNLTPVRASSEQAEGYLDAARRRLRAVELIAEVDPAGAFVCAYDAARLALAALLVHQGLRPRGEGAHAVLLEVALAQLEPPRQPALREFGWMRRLRNDTQYPDPERLPAGPEDLRQAIPAAAAIIERVQVLLPHLPPW